MVRIIVPASRVEDARPWLTLADLEAFDPHAPRGNGHERRFHCPLDGCRERAGVSENARALTLNVITGAWSCHRNPDHRGQLAEYRPAFTPTSRAARTHHQLERALAIRPPAPPAIDAGSAVAIQAVYDAAAALVDTDPAARYLTGRGVPAALAAAAGVRYALQYLGGGAVALFPIVGPDGALVAVHGRRLPGAAGKGERSKGPISAGVFATPGAITGPTVADPLAIVEAPIDALSLAAAGLPALALCGRSVGEQRAPWLRRLLAFRTVYAALDADPAGESGAEDLRRVLTGGTKVHRLRPPAPHKDWNAALQILGAAGVAADLQRQYPALPLPGVGAAAPSRETVPVARQDAVECRETAEAAAPHLRAATGPVEASARMTPAQTLRYAARHPEARCACGRRARHFRADGSWQCAACAGLLPPDPPEPPSRPELAALIAAYDALCDQLDDTWGAAFRAEDSGDAAGYARLAAEAQTLTAGPYAALGARVLVLAEAEGLSGDAQEPAP